MATLSTPASDCLTLWGIIDTLWLAALTGIVQLCNNRDYLHYQQYLANGYPIGTGVIEGACRHLVKDRFERAGMRWSMIGAQVMLDLRAVYLNGDWDDFQRFRRRQSHQKRYASLHPDVVPEELVLGVAA